jgi:diadenosine tetraphosphate (Ap4A) HIT family hydrolase
MSDDFELHPQLAADSLPVLDLPLLHLRLLNDSQYPWLVGIPRRAQLREIDELEATDQGLWLEETIAVMRVLRQVFNPHKINVAALGNQVPQLHVHYIARYTDDPAWPKPVWGLHPAQAYIPARAEQRIQNIRQAFAQLGLLEEPQHDA